MRLAGLACCIALGIGTAGAGTPSPASMSPGRIVALTRLTDHLPSATTTDREAVRAFLDERLSPYFDFDAMARRAAGPFYLHFSDTERGEFSVRVKAMFIEALASNLAPRPPGPARVDIYPTRFLRWGDEASVLARITSAPSAPVWMTYRFLRTPEGWKAFDAAANGFSAVTHFRTYFAALARRHGPGVFHRGREDR